MSGIMYRPAKFLFVTGLNMTFTSLIPGLCNTHPCFVFAVTKPTVIRITLLPPSVCSWPFFRSGRRADVLQRCERGRHCDICQRRRAGPHLMGAGHVQGHRSVPQAGAPYPGPEAEFQGRHCPATRCAHLPVL